MKSRPQTAKKTRKQAVSARLQAAKTLITWFKGKDLSFKDKSAFTLSSEYTLYKHLTSSVVRHKKRLEFLIEVLAGRPLKKLDAEVVICLMLGLVQLGEDSKVEQHAAIFETVELLKALHKPHLKGFVNANLRQYLRTQEQMKSRLGQQPLEVRSSHAEYMVDRWQKQFGKLQVEEICKANNTLPEVQVVVNPRFSMKEIVSDLEDRGFILSDLHESGFSVVNPAGLFESSWAQKGALLVQDRSFQIINQLVAELPKKKVLDACSAPGGKLVHLDWSFSEEIDLLVGAELSPSRMDRLRENRERLGSKAELLCMDATMPAVKGGFDLIIVDAPCSGTGTIRKHPEIKWNRQLQDFKTNNLRQLQILNALAPLVKDGGHLLYVTCSLEDEENQEVAEIFLQGNQDMFSHVPFKKDQLPENVINSDGHLQILPSEKNMGGYAVLFQRK